MNEMDRDGIRDGDLIRALHGEPHEAVPAEARARLEELRRRQQRFSSMLAELDPGPEATLASAVAIRPLLRRRPARRRATFQIAAAIVVLFGVSWLVPPARAWMLERIRAAASSVDEPSLAPPDLEESMPHRVPQPAAIRFSFPIDVDTFDILAAPRAGQLIIRHNRDALGTAEAAGAPEIRFTVARGLRIEGPAPRLAIYTITLPEHVTVVRLRARSYNLPAAPAELRLDLSGR